MSQKRSLPLNNPLQEKITGDNFLHCPYCSFQTKSNNVYQVHLGKYHEESLSREGDRSLREGGEKWKRNERWLLTHGYVECPWWTVPCPTKNNPLMARVCRYLNDCPS